MKKKIVVSAALLAAVLLAGGLLYFTHAHPLEKAAAAPAPPPAVSVVAGVVAQHDVPIYLSGVGTVIAYNTDVVRAQIQGQIISINFTEGQTVHAGDLLAQIDPRPYQALIEQYTGNLERDQAQLKNAQANLTRYSNLGDKGWATPQLVEKQQQKTKTPLAVLAYTQDNTTLLDQGVLGLVNNEILQTTGSIQLKANFPNKSRRLWPGELVNARLLVDTRHDGLTVAASAVQQGPSGAYVYVIDPNNTVESRPVKVAQISSGQALIDSGLKANEQVVVDGQYKLQPGTRVTMLHGQAAQEAIAQSAQQAPIP